MNTEFTLESNDSSRPYAWILEGVSMEDVTDAAEYVREYARNTINATNYSEDVTDDELFAAWLETGELEAATDYVKSKINEWQLEQVMTPAEIEAEFGLAEGTVRQAVNRDTIAHRRPDERTILIHRNDAEARWGHWRKREGYVPAVYHLETRSGRGWYTRITPTNQSPQDVVLEGLPEVDFYCHCDVLVDGSAKFWLPETAFHSESKYLADMALPPGSVKLP